MKIFGITIYSVVLILMGLFFFMLGGQAQGLDYYANEGGKAIESNNFNKYIEVFMNYNDYDEYLTKPVYHAKSDDELFPFDFMILQSKIESDNLTATLNHFYFVDHLENYNQFFTDNESLTLFNRNPKTAMFTIELLMEGEDEATATPIEISISRDSNNNYVSTSVDKTKMQPLALTYNYNEGNDNYFRYITFETIEDSKGRQQTETVWNESKTISRIEIYFDDYTKATDNIPVRTKVLSINHNDSGDTNTLDIIQRDKDGVYITNSFNGNIENYMDLDGFTDPLVASANKIEALKDYRSSRTKWLIIYIIGSFVATYLVFVLPKQIDKLKQNRFDKKYPKRVNSKKEDSKRIFTDE